MRPKCRKEITERTFWRKTEHRNKDTNSTKSSQWFTGVVSSKRAFKLREGYKTELYMVFLEYIFKVLQ